MFLFPLVSVDAKERSQVTKMLHNSLFTFFAEQGKTGKNGTHGNENLATYFGYFGRRKKNLRKYVMSWAILTEISSQAAAKSKPQVLGS